MSETFDVTAESHPALFQAFETISHDRGTKAGNSSYAVPSERRAECDAAELALMRLYGVDRTDDRFETFCIGDEDEAKAIAGSDPALGEAGHLLGSFFMRWSDGPGTPSPPLASGGTMAGVRTLVHDPNLCRNWGKKTFRLTFRLWDYEATREATVGGNCAGFANLGSALMQVLDALYPSDDRDAVPSIVLRRADGDEMLVEDEERRGERWLETLLVAAEMTALRPAAPGEDGGTVE